MPAICTLGSFDQDAAMSSSASRKASSRNSVAFGAISGRAIGSVESGIRHSTLPMALPLMAPNATLFLDDALRDAELDIAASWSKLPRVHIAGIVLYGHGLLTGRVGGPE